VLSQETIAQLAAELADAKRRRVPVRHFLMRHPRMTIDGGYTIQRAWVALRLAEGRVVKGRKIGLRSRAMQQSSQISEPDHARLLDDMFFEAGGDIAIDCSTRASSSSTARRKRRARCSTRSPMSPPAPASSPAAGRCGRTTVELRWAAAMLYKNGVIEETGLAAAVLNRRGNGVAWLANKIAPYDEQLNAGDVVLGGSLTRPTTALRGDVFDVDCGRLGSIALRFV
jgi:2-oxo-hept-3-ene-1,7-dioate hydratase